MEQTLESNESSSENSQVLEIIRDVEGGCKDWVSLSYLPLDVNNLINFTKSRRAGAVSSFLGTTREFFEDKEVVHLEYEAYNEMALQTMLEICDKVSDPLETFSLSKRIAICLYVINV